MSEKKKQAADPPTEIASEYYRHLHDCSSFAIVGADPQGLITSWNRSAEELFQIKAGDIIGRHIENIVPEKNRPLLHEAIEKARQQREIAELELAHPSEQDEVKALAAVITPILNDRDEILGIAAWVRDITNRKKLRQQLIQAEKISSLGTLASGVAHHFNNIIGGVATFVDYALTSNNHQAARRALQMTAEAAGRISGITTSLLTFAEKDMRQFDLADITEVLLTFSHLVEKPLAEKNIKLELHMQAVPVFEVPGTRIHQMLGNLLDNAENAMPHGGDIDIELHRRGENVFLEFRDTGCGIEPNILPHIFEPFFTTRGVSGGGDHPNSGLGLAVVDGIIRELSGAVRVKSTPGKGTAFIIRFPAKTAKREDPDLTLEANPEL